MHVLRDVYINVYWLLFVSLESSHEIMHHVLNDVIWFLAICTDHSSTLAQNCARSSALFLPTVSLHVARKINAYNKVCTLYFYVYIML